MSADATTIYERRRQNFGPQQRTVSWPSCWTPLRDDSDGQEPTDLDDTVAADASGLGPTVATPLDASQLTRMIATLDLDTLTVKRDRALLLFGFAGAVRRTKDDQEALGHDVGIPAFPGSPLCPVTMVDASRGTSGRPVRWGNPRDLVARAYPGVEALGGVGVRYERWHPRCPPPAVVAGIYGATVRGQGVGGVSEGGPLLSLGCEPASVLTPPLRPPRPRGEPESVAATASSPHGQ